MVLRGNTISPLEKILYYTAMFPLFLIVISIQYVEIKTSAQRESDPQVRRDRLERLNRGYRKWLLFVIPGWLVTTALCAWIISIL